MEDYYTKIPNEILEALYQVSLSNYEFRVFLFILRKTYGFNKKQDWLSQKQIAETTRIHKCHISRTIKKLSEKNMIINSKVKNKKIIGIQENYQEWKLPKQVTEVTQTGNYKLPKEAQTKETIQNNIYSQIEEMISYLNSKADKNFRGNSKSTIKDIRARLNKGFTLEDFKRVIDTKVNSWKSDPKMNAYLRPETLFGTKFESYLNEKNILEKPKVDYTDFIPKAIHCFTVDHNGYCENPTYAAVSGEMLTMCKICKNNKDKWKGS